MKLARFLARLSIQSGDFRSSGPAAPDESLIAILERLLIDPGTLESQALLKSVIAIIECEGELSDVDLHSLSRKSIHLLDQFAKDRLALRYPGASLHEIAAKLKHVPPVQ